MNTITYDDPTRLPAHKLAEEFASQRLSPVDVVESFLNRINAQDEKLHAFVGVYGKDARVAAEAADKAIRSGHAIGPLHGIPIALKDLIEIEGKIITGGSAIWRDRLATRTATIVNRLLAEGMIIIGKTHTVEVAFGGWGTNQHMGTPWNPWDQKIARAPGGSSSGSAVAVAARFVPWAIGTDTGGSIRVPASWCGLTGLKPSGGRISTYGILPLSPTLDTPGPLGRSVEDVSLLYQSLAGPDPLDPRTLVQPLAEKMSKLRNGIQGKHLACLPLAERGVVADDVLDAYDRSIEILVELGAKVVPFSLPFSFADMMALNGFIMKAEAYALYANFVDDKSLLLDEDVRLRILAGKDILAKDYLSALYKRKSMQQEFNSVMANVDAFLTPTTLTTAVPLTAVDQSTTPAHFTRFANFLDLCAISLPNGISAEGLPTSLQIMGKCFDEEGILNIGWIYQNATIWHEKEPPSNEYMRKK